MWCILFEEEIRSLSFLANQFLLLMFKEEKSAFRQSSLLPVHCLMSCLFVQALLPRTEIKEDVYLNTKPCIHKSLAQRRVLLSPFYFIRFVAKLFSLFFGNAESLQSKSTFFLSLSNAQHMVYFENPNLFANFRMLVVEFQNIIING